MKIVAVVFVALVATNFIGGDSPERKMIYENFNAKFM